MRFSIFFIVILSCLNLWAKKQGKDDNQDPTPFLLFYQPLFEMSPIKAKSYLSEVRKLFASHQEENTEFLLMAKPSNDDCLKKGLNSCLPALYMQERCIPKDQKASLYCLKKGKSPKLHFKEPIFNRIEWNKFAVQLTYFCNKNSAKVCAPLAQLHDRYMKDYKALMAERRKQQEQYRQSPFKKMRKKRAKN